MRVCRANGARIVHTTPARQPGALPITPTTHPVPRYLLPIIVVDALVFLCTLGLAVWAFALYKHPHRAPMLLALGVDPHHVASDGKTTLATILEARELSAETLADPKYRDLTRRLATLAISVRRPAPAPP